MSTVLEPTLFRAGPIEGVVFRAPEEHRDKRGWLVEWFRIDELPQEQWPVMAYVSVTEPGATRGPHEHREQTDFFAFLGPGNLELYLWDSRCESPTRGHRQRVVVGEGHPQIVIVPPGVVHAYRNPGPGPAWVLNAPNRLYAGAGHEEPVDEVRHESRDWHPYLMQ